MPPSPRLVHALWRWTRVLDKIICAHLLDTTLCPSNARAPCFRSSPHALPTIGFRSLSMLPCRIGTIHIRDSSPPSLASSCHVTCMICTPTCCCALPYVEVLTIGMLLLSLSQFRKKNNLSLRSKCTATEDRTTQGLLGAAPLSRTLAALCTLQVRQAARYHLERLRPYKAAGFFEEASERL